MRFAKDLFISYAHIDNQPLTSEQQGWISRFHTTLEALLSMRMGSQAQIWRDDKLQGNDVFADEIVDQFSQTAVLVSVLTPRYLNSDWCTKEVTEFCKSAEQRGGMNVVMIVKTPEKSWKANYATTAITSCPINSYPATRPTMWPPSNACWPTASYPSISSARAMAAYPIDPTTKRSGK